MKSKQDSNEDILGILFKNLFYVLFVQWDK